MKIAIVEWWPRICGATDWALHLSHAHPPRGVTLDRVTFSSSGRALAAWERADLWKIHRQKDAVEVLNRYDLLILSDVVCFAPALVKRGREIPYYVDVLNRIRTPWTSMYHGGTYPSKYDDTLRAVLTSRSFCGALITTRLPDARRRLDHLVKKPIRWANYPHLPYSRAFRPPPVNAVIPIHRRSRSTFLMTARIAVNKGQNVAMWLAPFIRATLLMYGYNAFGLPSIGWRLWELSNALGYSVLKAPILRRDVSHLTHPKAVRFYTGKFSVGSKGAVMKYLDGYLGLDEIDWNAAAYHLSLANADFGGTLEYVSLDAINAGAVAVVPEHAVAYVRRPTAVTLPFSRASIWSREDGSPRVTIDPAEAEAMTAKLEWLMKLNTRSLSMIAADQRRELETKHQPEVVLKKLLDHVITKEIRVRAANRTGTRTNSTNSTTSQT